MTKQDLLARAKELGIKGRHEMSKETLERAVSEHEQVVELIEESVAERHALDQTARELGVENPEALNLADLQTTVEQRRAVKAQSDMVATMAAEVKLKRGRGNNLNSPWQPKPYYLDLDVYAQRKAGGELGKAPMQVQLMLKYMVEHGVTSRRAARRGGDVCSDAVAKRYLVTSIEPHVLFAYYRRRMETLGLVFAGYVTDAGDPEKQVEAEDAAALEEVAEDSDEGGSE